MTPDPVAFAASLFKLQRLCIALLALALGVTLGGLVRLGIVIVIACLVVQTIALEKMRVFVASWGNRR